jgi:membrane protease YdiL (CAAX protease family)
MTGETPAISTSRRLVVVGVLFGLFFPTLLTWVYFVLLAQSTPSLQQATYTVGKAIQFGFPVVWVLLVRQQRFERRARSPRRTGSMSRTSGIAWGLAFGASVFICSLAAYHGGLKSSGLLEHAGEAVAARLAAFGIRSVGFYLAVGVFYSLCHSFLEEYYWRWFVFGQLRQLVPWPVAILVSSLGFMSHHVLVLATYFGWLSGATWGFSLAVALGGVFWAWLYQRSDSLVGPWLSHLLIDAAIFTIGFNLANL